MKKLHKPTTERAGGSSVWIFDGVRLIDLGVGQHDRDLLIDGRDSNPEPTPLQSGTGCHLSKGARRTMLKIAND